MKRLIEIANDNHVTKQTIYKRLFQLSRALHGHVHKHRHRYYVDRVGCEIISKSINPNSTYKRKHPKKINVNYITKLRHTFDNEVNQVRTDYKTELKDKTHTIKSLLNHVDTQDEEIEQLRKDLQEARKHLPFWETIRNHFK